MPILLKNQTAAELAEALRPLGGLTLRMARIVHATAVRRGCYPEPQPDLSAAALARIRAATAIPALALLSRVESPADGFVRYVLRGAGPEPFEAVRIPLLHRPDDPKYIACVSSQVGCALGCAFCATGRLGFRRNLAPWEIVDQVGTIRADSLHPVAGVVFMGMGEPLLNYDAVMRAAAILSEPCGMAIAAKAISISTAGITPAIRRFTAERRPYRLIVSLTSADPALRRTLMPVEDRFPTPDLLDALREHHRATNRRVVLAWPMLTGLNTRPEDARQLAGLLAGLPVRLDLIDVCDPHGRFAPPSDRELAAFRDALRLHLAMPVARRYSGGRDIHAGCGMLAGPDLPLDQ